MCAAEITNAVAYVVIRICALGFGIWWERSMRVAQNSKEWNELFGPVLHLSVFFTPFMALMSIFIRLPR